MAYYYRGDGFQLQQQTGGYNIANQVYANMSQNNPFKHAKDTSTNLDALVEEARLDEANKYLLETANPYDGKTAAQKLREVGLDNWYTRKNLDKLNTNYSSETKNMTEARQSASDFRTEALQTEALRLKAQGDPKAISEYNDYIAQTLQAMVANGSVTPKTAKSIYDNLSVNAAQQERATIANTYAQARSSNASAHLNELKADDFIQEQNDLNVLKYIMDFGRQRGIAVTDINTALTAGRLAGIPDSQIMAALGSTNIERYKNQYGSTLEQYGKANLLDAGALLAPSALGVSSTANPQSQYIIQEPVPASGTIQTGSQMVSSSGVVPNTPSASTAPTTSATPTSNAATATAPTTTPNTASASATATPSALNSSNTSTVANAPNASGSTVGTNINTGTGTQQQQNAQDFNKVAEQTAKQSSGAVVQNNANGEPSIAIDSSSAYFDSSSGVWKFDPTKIPSDKTNTYQMGSMHSKLVDIDRQLSGKMRDMFNVAVDESGGIKLVPTAQVKSYLEKFPEKLPAYRAIESQILDAYSIGLSDRNNLQATLAHMYATFSPTKEARNMYSDQYRKLLNDSTNTQLAEDLNAAVDRQYAEDPNIPFLLNNAATFVNAASAGNNSALLQTVVNGDLATQNAYINDSIKKSTATQAKLENDVSAVRSDVAMIEAIQQTSNLVRSLAGSSNTAITAILNSEDAIAKPAIESLLSAGVIVLAPKNKDGSTTDADSLEETYDLVENKYAEYSKALEDGARALQEENPSLDISEARAIAMFSGVKSAKDLSTYWFPHLTNTNSSFVIDLDSANGIAKTFAEYSTPNGREKYNTVKQMVTDLDKAKELLTTSQTNLAASSKQLSDSVSSLGNYGLTNKRRIDTTNNTVTNEIVPTTLAGRNDLLFGGQYSSLIKTNVNNYYDSIAAYGAAVQNLNNVGRKITEYRIATDNQKRLTTNTRYDPLWNNQSIGFNPVLTTNGSTPPTVNPYRYPYMYNGGLLPNPSQSTTNTSSKINTDADISSVFDKFMPKTPINANALSSGTTNTNTNNSNSTGTKPASQSTESSPIAETSLYKNMPEPLKQLSSNNLYAANNIKVPLRDPEPSSSSPEEIAAAQINYKNLDADSKRLIDSLPEEQAMYVLSNEQRLSEFIKSIQYYSASPAYTPEPASETTPEPISAQKLIENTPNQQTTTVTPSTSTTAQKPVQEQETTVQPDTPTQTPTQESYTEKGIATPEELKNGISTKISPFVSLTAQNNNNINNNSVARVEEELRNARPLSERSSMLQNGITESSSLTEEAIQNAPTTSSLSGRSGILQNNELSTQTSPVQQKSKTHTATDLQKRESKDTNIQDTTPESITATDLQTGVNQSTNTDTNTQGDNQKLIDKAMSGDTSSQVEILNNYFDSVDNNNNSSASKISPSIVEDTVDKLGEVSENNPDILYTLARAHEHGFGSKRSAAGDLTYSKQLYLKAAQQGHTGAQDALQRLHVSKEEIAELDQINRQFDEAGTKGSTIDAPQLKAPNINNNSSRPPIENAKTENTKTKNTKTVDSKTKNINFVNPYWDNAAVVDAPQSKAPNINNNSSIVNRKTYYNPDYSNPAKLENMASQGDYTAQLKLGDMYLNGNSGVKQDYQKAAKWYSKAAELDVPKAQRILGNMYHTGKGVKQDYEKAFKLYIKAAAKEDPQAQYYIGSMYANGQGVDKSLQDAAYWYSKAARKNYSDAQFALASIYETGGDGLKQDYGEATYWYDRAIKSEERESLRLRAEQGDVEAQYALGVSYGHDEPNISNVNNSSRYFTMAAEQGHAGAQYFIGAMHETGQGVVQDLSKAVEWYTKAAEQGNARGQYRLGHLYKTGEGVDKDLSKSINLLTKAAEQGHNLAIVELADSYYKGQGVKQDYQKAFELYSQAAEQGSAEAQYALSTMYDKGLIGNKKDASKSIKWLTQSAENGYSIAQNSLGNKYFSGDGVKQNDQKAAEWYNEAADNGEAEAMAKLGFMYSYGRGTDQDYQRAFKWTEQAANKGNDSAVHSLGKMYEYGIGVRQDQNKARKLYSKLHNQDKTTTTQNNTTKQSNDTLDANNLIKGTTTNTTTSKSKATPIPNNVTNTSKGKVAAPTTTVNSKVNTNTTNTAANSTNAKAATAQQQPKKNVLSAQERNKLLETMNSKPTLIRLDTDTNELTGNSKGNTNYKGTPKDVKRSLDAIKSYREKNLITPKMENSLKYFLRGSDETSQYIVNALDNFSDKEALELIIKLAKEDNRKL